MENIGNEIEQYSSYLMFYLVTLYELTLFSFITGHADMHLKNFSFLTIENNVVLLKPAQDRLATKLLIPADNEEFALSLYGKNRGFIKSHFIAFAKKLEIINKNVKNVQEKFHTETDGMLDFINKGFLSTNMKK